MSYLDLAWQGGVLSVILDRMLSPQAASLQGTPNQGGHAESRGLKVPQSSRIITDSQSQFPDYNIGDSMPQGTRY
jgi:hypothetical protein